MIGHIHLQYNNSVKTHKNREEFCFMKKQKLKLVAVVTCLALNFAAFMPAGVAAQDAPYCRKG